MKRQITSAADRLIVAADFKPTGSNGPIWVRDQVLMLARALQGTNVCIKINSALRANGQVLIKEIHACGLKVFADLKLYDIPNTLETDGAILKDARPEFLTVVCSAGHKAMQALQEQLPDTEILGITVLTSQTDEDVLDIYGTSMDGAVITLAKQAVKAGIGGLIASPKEATLLRKEFGDTFTINTPGIRPMWHVVEGDDQNRDRVMTPGRAIRAGADRIVIGRPVLNAADPNEAVRRTLEEIEEAVCVLTTGRSLDGTSASV